MKDNSTKEKDEPLPRPEAHGSPFSASALLRLQLWPNGMSQTQAAANAEGTEDSSKYLIIITAQMQETETVCLRSRSGQKPKDSSRGRGGEGCSQARRKLLHGEG